MNRPDWVMFGIPQEDGSVMVYMTGGVVEAKLQVARLDAGRVASTGPVNLDLGDRSETTVSARAVGKRTWVKGVDYKQCLASLVSFWKEQEHGL